MPEAPDASTTKGRSMLENVKRIRQPVTWAVLVIICASLVLGIVRLTLLVFWERTQVFAAFQEIGLSIMNLSLVIVLVGLVCTCLFVQPATANAVRLAKLSAWVIAIGTLLQLVCLILGLAASANAFGVIMEMFGGLLDVALKGVAAGVLFVLVRGVNSGRLDLAPAVPEVSAPTGTEKAQPVWRPEQASGTAWRSARQAASGARPDVGALSPSEPAQEPTVPPERQWKPRLNDGGEK